jgi:hypothetical protein
MSHQEPDAMRRAQILAGRSWRAIGRSVFTLGQSARTRREAG